MSAEWRHVTRTEGRHTVSQEYLHPQGFEQPTHSLGVGTTTMRGEDAPTHGAVTLAHRDPLTGRRTHVSLAFRGNQWTVSRNILEGGEVVAEPSETLKRLIHGYHDAPPSSRWMPLLDELVSQYPEHFTDHVERHTRARVSG